MSGRPTNARRGFELLEHRADVGIRGSGATLAEAFEQVALGLIEILGFHRAGPARRRPIHLTGPDHGALLVDLVNELVLLHETEGVALVEPRVSELTPTSLEGSIGVAPLAEEPDGIVKAATYHRLLVDEGDGSATVEVYLDV
jgi:SHS2 domain-containing protein